MRVTNKMIENSVVSSLLRQRDRLKILQESIASGKKLNRPSDDPVAMAQALNYKKALSLAGQYLRNIDHANGFLASAESALNNVLNHIIKAKDIALAMADATVSVVQRKNSANEIAGIRDQIVQLANADFAGKYIFAGRKTSTAPFSIDGAGAVAYAGDSGSIQIEIGKDSKETINSPGSKVFSGSGGGVDIFSALNSLKTALENNDVSAIESQMGQLQRAFDQINEEISSTGTRMALLDTAKNNLGDSEANLKKFVSDAEDADIEKIVTDLVSQQIAFEASLAAAAGILRMSLLDFLR